MKQQCVAECQKYKELKGCGVEAVRKKLEKEEVGIPCLELQFLKYDHKFANKLSELYNNREPPTPTEPPESDSPDSTEGSNEPRAKRSYETFDLGSVEESLTQKRPRKEPIRLSLYHTCKYQHCLNSAVAFNN